MIQHILFDLDNTLYPISSGFSRQISKLMTEYVADLLSISVEDAAELRKKTTPVYGTTLKWLQKEHGFSAAEDYYEKVHPQDVSTFLSKSPSLPRLLDSLPQGKSILSNAPIEHVNRVLRFLEVEDFFDTIFEVRSGPGTGKPDADVYTHAIRTLQIPQENMLFVDDVPGYLLPFEKMGGYTVLIDELNLYPDSGFRRIPMIDQLPDIVKELP
ncbi:MAG: HAD-IA family hydrolase [Spirochaetia bacterium]